MELRGGRRRWLAGVVAGLVVCALGVVLLLVRAGLEDADRWASVIGVFLNFAGVFVAGYSAVQARRVATAPRTSLDAGNRISGGEFVGPVVMGRDLEQVSATGEAVPDLPAAGPPQGGGPPAGDWSNTIEDGRFHEPVFMVRDSRRVALPRAQRPDADGSPR